MITVRVGVLDTTLGHRRRVRVNVWKERVIIYNNIILCTGVSRLRFYFPLTILGLGISL